MNLVIIEIVEIATVNFNYIETFRLKKVLPENRKASFPRKLQCNERKIRFLHNIM